MSANTDQLPPLPSKEQANFPPFITELCQLFGLPTPDPASDNQEDNAYVLGHL